MGRSSPGGGYVRSCALAEDKFLRLPTNSPHFSPVRESNTGAVVGHPGSSRPLIGAVVCRNDPHACSSALDDPTVLEGPVSGSRGDRLPVHLVPTSSGLAPERDKLGRAGLSVY